MPDDTYHLFLSYCRRDDVAMHLGDMGWVSAFCEELKRRHKKYSGRELKIFFDTEAIGEGRDWRRELGTGIRQSRLFLAFLSPHYITSENCLWEWEEYLLREHSAARGDDGLTPIFFVAPDDLRLAENQRILDWLAEMEQKYPWFKHNPNRCGPDAERLAQPFVKDLNRRNNKFVVELHDWFACGDRILREQDAAERLKAIRDSGRDPSADERTLQQRLDEFDNRLVELDRHIARRLDRLALADLAPGNLTRSHEHFVGRHQELCELHTIMLTGGPQSGGSGMGGRGMIAATFAPGGLGKTALARQYAHAYAEFYAAGGTWEVGCEGANQLGAVLLRLADNTQFQNACILRFDIDTQQPDYVTQPLQLSEDDRQDYRKAAVAVLEFLERLTFARREILLDELGRRVDEGKAERHTPVDEPPELERPRALLILDNADKPELLSATQIALLPAKEWLEVIVTTRLHPEKFGGGDRTFAHLEISVLPDSDAVKLLADFQPGRRFASDAEEQSAREIVKALGGWTIAIEISAAFIGDRAKRGRPTPVADFLDKLNQAGLAWVDDLTAKPAVDQALRHGKSISDEHERKRQNRVGTLVRWSMDQLSAPARTALEFASLLRPDEIPLAWLRQLTLNRHPEIEVKDIDNDHDWASVWHELHSLRLLHPAGEVQSDERGVEQLPEVVRIHRLVAQHVSTDGLPDHFIELDQFFTALGMRFEQQVGQTHDAALRFQHPWLRDQLDHLITNRLPTSTLLQSAQVAADFEGTHGSLVRAIDLTARILEAKEKILTDNPSSAQAARDVSVSLERLADFLAQRGQPGDAENALGFYQRSLQVSEQLWKDNPGSAQAARDVSVSLNKLADFLAKRGQPGDAEKALGFYQRCHEVLEQLLADNPSSAQAARDVQVSLERMAAMEAQHGDTAKGLEFQMRALQIALQLRESNPGSMVYNRTAAISFFLTFQRAQAAGNEQLSAQCLAGCYSILHEMINIGMTLDPQLAGLYEQLRPMFGDGNES